MNISPAERDAHEETLRALPAIESAAFEVASDDTRSLPKDPEDASETLRERLERTFLAARRAARTQARRRLADEIEAVELRARPRRSLVGSIIARPSLTDDEEARRAARHFSDLIRRRASESDPRSAVVRSRSALNALSRTVTAEAWGDERERVLTALAREQSGSDVLPVMGKIWDARLDACPACHRLDGTMRPIAVGFSGGAVPGLMHKSCRCVGLLIAIPVLSSMTAD